MIIILLILVMAGLGNATIINIPADYPTVQQGLNAALEGDTVLVADGIYSENLVYPNCNLFLASWYLLDGDTTHISNTILDGSQPSNPDSGSVLYMEGGQDSTTVIMGLTLQGGTGTLNSSWWGGNPKRYGGGCVIRHAAPVLKYNRIHHNSAYYGGGLYLLGDDGIFLQNNEIFYNQYITSGGGLKGDSCSATLLSNHIHHNSSGYQAGGIMFWFCDTIVIADNDIDHNEAVVDGAAGFCAPGTFLVTGNVISDNYLSSPNVGAGLNFGVSPGFTYVTLTNNQFLRNEGGFIYGALGMSSGVQGVVMDNVFQDNSSYEAAGITLWNGIFTISNNQFINNTGTLSGTIYIGTGVYVQIFDNVFTGNIGSPQNASAIFAYTNVSTNVIYDNNIYGNSPPAVAISSDSPFPTLNAINNWWGDASGPYHPILNPTGLGDAVGDSVLFDPWLTEPVWAPPASPRTTPERFLLSPAYPNPFNPITTIGFALPQAARVSLIVYDVSGRIVATLVNGWREAGNHEVTFDAGELPSGVYLAKLEAGNFSAVQKLVLLK